AKDACDRAEAAHNRAQEDYKRAKEVLDKAEAAHKKAKQTQEAAVVEWRRWYQMRKEKEKEWGDIVEKCKATEIHQPESLSTDQLKQFATNVQGYELLASGIGRLHQERKEEWLASGQAQEATASQRERKRKRSESSDY
ncbi:5440_t:CDS:2, partial [Acaulospora colombiana]